MQSKNDALFKGLGTFCMTQNTNVHRITLNLLTVHEYYDGSKRPWNYYLLRC